MQTIKHTLNIWNVIWGSLLVNSRHPETPAHGREVPNCTSWHPIRGDPRGSPGSRDEFLTPNSVRRYPQKVGSGCPIFGKNSFWTLPGLKTQNHEEINFLYIQLENQVFQKTLISEWKKPRKFEEFQKNKKWSHIDSGHFEQVSWPRNNAASRVFQKSLFSWKIAFRRSPDSEARPPRGKNRLKLSLV